MAFLSDTNCLPRWARPKHPLYAVARAAVKVLQDRSEGLYVAPQNLIEF